MRATLFHNPAAGDGKTSPEAVVACVEKMGFSVAYCSTKSEEFVEALNWPAEMLIAAGGDGTVAKVATRMPDRTIPLAILALGTANNVARSYGIPLDLEGAQLRSSRRRRLRIGQARGPWKTRRFIESVGLGALAAMICDPAARREEPDRDARIHKARKALSRLIGSVDSFEAELTLDQRTHCGAFLAVEFTAIACVGPSLRLADLADPRGELVEVVLFEQARRKEIKAWVEDPGRAPPPVRIEQARRVSIPWSSAPLRIDDKARKPPDGPQTVTVAFETEAVGLVVPEET